MHSQTNTYGFRNTGRRPTSARFYTSGEVLLPGAYEHSDFLDDVTRKPKTYNFRSIEREAGPKIGHGYGDKVWLIHVIIINFNLLMLSGTGHKPDLVWS